MNRLTKVRLRKVLAGAAISVVVISGFVLFASTANATTFPVFDHMDSDAQAEFIADMVDRTEQALRDGGKPDLALKTEQLFAQDKPSDPLSVGLAELESNVGHARVADFDRLAKDPKTPRVQVEVALFLTLKNNGIELSSSAMNSVLNAMTHFHEMTHAEFRVQSPSEQRHTVRLFAEIAIPDYLIRDALAKKKSTLFGLDDQATRNLAEMMSTQFPHSGDQRGFAHVASDVENNSAKYANVPVFYTVVLYFERELQKGNLANLRRECGEIPLSNGRWVLRVEQGGSFDEAMKKFQECIGPAAAAAVAQQRQEPAAAAPPAAEPPSPPASPADDDPMGGGGFITPPTNFNALLCVSADLANNSEWSNPEGGSKMDTFKHQVGSYVNSVAKPGWEYWIMPGQYERFDPATTSSGAQFVSAVSPDSGRFDEFNPKCPSGYAAFWVKVSH